MPSRGKVEEIVREIFETNIDRYTSRYAAGRKEYNRLASPQRLIHLEEELKGWR